MHVIDLSAYIKANIFDEFDSLIWLLKTFKF